MFPQIIILVDLAVLVGVFGLLGAFEGRAAAATAR